MLGSRFEEFATVTYYKHSAGYSPPARVVGITTVCICFIMLLNLHKPQQNQPSSHG